VWRRISGCSRPGQEADHQGNRDKMGHQHDWVSKRPAVNIA
jgi:hypothetical protein